MARKIIAVAALLAAALHGSAASAGVYTDDLSKCLVSASSDADKVTLVRWIYATFALNPSVKPLTAVSPEQRDALNRQMAILMQRLMLKDCRPQTVSAVKYEGPLALQSGFQVLGEVAARGLMSDPSVAAGLQGFGAYIDKAQFEALGKEAGLAPGVSSPVISSPAK